jgi:lipoprotein-anchoring transpeptidase ErfK/SrfK
MTGETRPRARLAALTGLLVSCLAPLVFSSCGTVPFIGAKDHRNKMIVSVSDQRMLLVTDGKPVRTYKISTSKFGLGDRPGSNRTPLGRLQVAKKIGGNAPLGAVFKNRKPTGEVIQPNAPGRDPIVTRILWLRGTESRNRNSYRRTIYIHGTPEERRLGHPASYGCIRMGSQDVADLFKRVGHGADVFVVPGSIRMSAGDQMTASANRLVSWFGG